MELMLRAKMHAALSDPLRLRMIEAIGRHDRICGKELAESLGASVALVSHHAKVLEDAGLIVRHREGQFIRFSLDLDALGQLGAAWSTREV